MPSASPLVDPWLSKPVFDTFLRALKRIGSFTWQGQTFETHNRLLDRYQGADGVKTGSTTQAGYGVVEASHGATSSSYAASKGAQLSFTKSLALELEKRGYDWVKQEAAARRYAIPHRHHSPPPS